MSCHTRKPLKHSFGWLQDSHSCPSKFASMLKGPMSLQKQIVALSVPTNEAWELHRRATATPMPLPAFLLSSCCDITDDFGDAGLQACCMAPLSSQNNVAALSPFANSIKYQSQLCCQHLPTCQRTDLADELPGLRPLTQCVPRLTIQNDGRSAHDANSARQVLIPTPTSCSNCQLLSTQTRMQKLCTCTCVRVISPDLLNRCRELFWLCSVVMGLHTTRKHKL